MEDHIYGNVVFLNYKENTYQHNLKRSFGELKIRMSSFFFSFGCSISSFSEKDADTSFIQSCLATLLLVKDYRNIIMILSVALLSPFL